MGEIVGGLNVLPGAIAGATSLADWIKSWGDDDDAWFS